MALADTDLARVPEADLVARARARDEQAVRELTRRYNRRLYRLARGILLNDTEAEDVVQEAYGRAFTSLDRFRGDAAFGTWITRIAMNEALGRKRRRRPTSEWTPETEARASAAVIPFPVRLTSHDPERQMAEREVRELIERSIDALPDGFRLAFIAREVEGLSLEEAATVLGIRPETVKTRVHRARRRLRAEIERRIGPGLAAAFPFDGARCERMTEAVVRRVFGNVPPSSTSNPF
jgi:RNA polymerase sigma-70 factor (ECF subfamily)